LIISTPDEKGNKALTGGMMKRQMPQQQITNYINVKSIDEYCSKIEKLGGKVIILSPVAGMGYFAVCLDTENNSFTIWNLTRMLSEYSQNKWV
jgi:predicted enzyme related to lactoylglutathione lyase